MTYATGPPAGPSVGDVWFSSSDGVFSMYVNDGDSNQWVEISGKQGETGPAGAAGVGGTGYGVGAGLTLNVAGGTFSIDPTANIHVAGISADGGITMPDGKFITWLPSGSAIENWSSTKGNKILFTDTNWGSIRLQTDGSDRLWVSGQNGVQVKTKPLTAEAGFISDLVVQAKTGISMDAAGITFSDGTYQSTAGGEVSGSYTGQIETASNKTYTIDPSAVVDRTITSFYARTGGGTCDITVKNAGATAAFLTATTSSGATGPSGNTGITADNAVTLVITSANLATDVAFSVEYTQ